MCSWAKVSLRVCQAAHIQQRGRERALLCCSELVTLPHSWGLMCAEQERVGRHASWQHRGCAHHPHKIFSTSQHHSSLQATLKVEILVQIISSRWASPTNVLPPTRPVGFFNWVHAWKVKGKSWPFWSPEFFCHGQGTYFAPRVRSWTS